MKNFLLLPISALIILLFASSVFAQNPAFDMRREAYIDSCLQNLNTNAVAMQAYRGLPVDSALLADMINDVPTRSTADFVIVRMVRTMLLDTAARYDTLIMPMLDTIPFWLEPNDDLRSYWSENHWIMWNGSSWLLHEYYGKAIDNNLRNRLGHYLRMKVKYGFYEFWSPIYTPYTLSGLLNLADFAQDPELKQLATLAVNRFLRELLYNVNDEGSFYPSAGRSSHGNYRSNGGPRAMFYLLTGLGDQPVTAAHDGGFIATTSIDVDSIMNSWQPVEDLVMDLGHSIDSAYILNDTIAELDRRLFHWSGGGYFHPTFALHSAETVVDYDLWGHPDFDNFTTFQGFPASTLADIALGVTAVSESSVLMDYRYHIFKHHGIMMSSVEDYWKGQAGYQQTPIMATLGDATVYTASGVVTPKFHDRSGLNNNTHLPYVQQRSNLALAMYWPDPQLAVLGSFGFADQDVALKFEESDFDEITEANNWLMGRKDEDYIAIYRPCLDSIEGNWACTNTDGQTWVYFLGDSGMYSNFSNFQQIVGQATVTENRAYTKADTTQWLYYAKVNIDGDSIAYEWTRDTVVASALDIEPELNNFTVYPNPASDYVMLVTPQGQQLDVQISVTNLIGQQVYWFDGTMNNRGLQVNIADWNTGLYLVNIKSELGVETKRLMVE